MSTTHLHHDLRAAESASPPVVPRLVATALALSLVFTVVETLRHAAPPDFDATTPTVWAGYVAVAATALLARRQETWARRAVSAALVAYLVAAVLVYPRYFTAPYQDTFGWFENDAYVALLALALWENVRVRPGRRDRTP